MICRTDLFRIALALILPAALAACSESAEPPPTLGEAQAALARGDGFAAEAVLTAMIEGGRAERSEIAVYMAEAERLQGKRAEARYWLLDVEHSPETRGHGHHLLGLLELDEGDLPAAAAAFDKALAEGADEPELWVDIARLRYSGGEHQLAIDAAERAVELGPANPYALQFRGRLVRDAHGMAAALPWFEAAIEASPDNLSVLADYAATLGELGRAKDMLATIRRMTALDGGNREAMYLQAVLAARAGRFTLARTLLTRAGEIGRERPSAMLLSGIIDLESGNYASAAQMFDRLARLQPENRRVRPLLARALSLGGNHRELVYRFSETVERGDNSPYLQILVARAYEALGERDKAASLLDRVVRPGKAEWWPLPAPIPLEVAAGRGSTSGLETLSLVRGFIASGPRSQAITNAEAFLSRHPASADAASLAGDAQLAAGRAKEAMARYSQSARVKRPWPLTRRMALAAIRAGQADDAASLVHAHLAGHPGNAEAASWAAARAYEAGEFPRAALLLDHALANGSARDPQLLSLRAEIAMRLGDEAQAEGFARRAFALRRSDPAVSRTLAAILAAGKDGAGSGGDALLAKARIIESEPRLARR